MVSFKASAVYSDLSSVPRLPQMRRVQKLKRSMLLQYKAQTDSFGDNDWEHSVNEVEETRSFASPGNNKAYWSKFINEHRDNSRNTHITRISQPKVHRLIPMTNAQRVVN